MSNTKFTLAVYYARKKYFIESLGGKCIICGSVDKLEFDHIDPSNKEHTITSLLSYSEDKIKEELTKCQLLCHNCHKAKTYGKQEGLNDILEFNCINCGNILIRTRRQFNKQVRLKKIGFACSKSCAGTYGTKTQKGNYIKEFAAGNEVSETR